MNDDHKNEGTQAGNGVTSEEEEVKELPPPNKHRSKGWKKIEFKPKEQAEAERLFFFFFPEASHWKPPSILLPFDPVTCVPYFKKIA
ncbi:MAG: hypothetical protein Q8L00_01790, partial [Deltaproteobacteria bacterium]|nr:hypothetical protein [Deltaproteobacteria bacterium]